MAAVTMGEWLTKLYFVEVILFILGYGISLGVSQNRPFFKVLIMPTKLENEVGMRK